MILKYLWKLLANRQREYLAKQLNTLKQNAEQKEKQLKSLQISAREQTGMEVKNTAKPIVVELAKKNVLSVSKEIVPQVVNRCMSKLSLLKTVPKESEISKPLSFSLMIPL